MRFRFPYDWLTGLLFLAFAGCGNEPYDTGTISVISINDTKQKTLYSYQYKQGKLFMFKAISSTGGNVLTWSNFYYDVDLLDRIMRDSTAVGYSLTQIKRGTAEPGIIGDSTTIVQIDTVQMDTILLVSKNSYEYDGDHLMAVTQRAWTGATLVESRHEFTWQAGNLTEMTSYIFKNGVNEVVGSTTVEFDKKNNVYNHDFVFMYTMPLAKLYWLSRNNPVLVKEASMPDLKLKYVYNKFQYPSVYKSEADLNTEFAISYTEIK